MIIQFEESRWSYDSFIDEDVLVHDGTYVVDTDRIEEFCVEHDYEYRYVKYLVETAVAGSRFLEASRKFSFGDCPDWYENLRPVDPKAKVDRIVEVEVHL